MILKSKKNKLLFLLLFLVLGVLITCTYINSKKSTENYVDYPQVSQENKKYIINNRLKLSLPEDAKVLDFYNDEFCLYAHISISSEDYNNILNSDTVITSWHTKSMLGTIKGNCSWLNPQYTELEWWGKKNNAEYYTINIPTTVREKNIFGTTRSTAYRSFYFFKNNNFYEMYCSYERG